MNRYIRDMLMRGRDGRNPYGSRGGYVKDRRMQRDYRRDYANGNNEYNDRYGNEQGQDQRDMARYRDMERSGQYDRHYQPIEIMGRFNGYYGGENDYARGRDYGYGSDYARSGDYRQDYARRDMRDYGYGSDYNYDMRRDYDYMPYDYAQGSGYLSDKELKMWADKLMKSVDEKDMQFLSRENIRKKADELGIKFEKYSFEEFYVAVLMNYTDHCKTIGNANMDTYLKLAKDFLEDEDTAVQNGEKLATYYDYIVQGM